MRELIAGTAAAAGYAIRFLALFTFNVVPPVAGICLVIYGVSLFDPRLGWIAAGLAVLILFYWPRQKETK